MVPLRKEDKTFNSAIMFALVRSNLTTNFDLLYMDVHLKANDCFLYLQELEVYDIHSFSLNMIVLPFPESMT